ncbi:acyl-CoA dehydrogenase family protein [Bradyrhizobium sp. Arg314]
MTGRKIFSAEHEMFRETARKFFETEVVPELDSWEENGRPPRDFWNRAGEHGLLGPTVPEEFGGPGGDYLYSAVIDEELAKAGAANAAGLSVHNDIVVPYLVSFASQELKEKWLPKMVTGEAVGAMAMTEPDGGSDLKAVRTTARRDGDEWVINGRKTFISNAASADIILVAARTNEASGAKGLSLIVVEASRDGYSLGRLLKKAGLKGGDTGEMFFDNVRVPVTNLVGEEGQGFAYMMEKLATERLGIAVMAVAHAEAALGWTIEYVKDRKAFGKPLFELQNTRFKLAEAKADVTLGRLMVDKCLELYIENNLDISTAAMAKFWCSDMQFRVMDECVQLHGGYGYMWEYPITRAWADSRVQRVYGGANEIMKELVARSL